MSTGTVGAGAVMEMGCAQMGLRVYLAMGEG